MSSVGAVFATAMKIVKFIWMVTKFVIIFFYSLIRLCFNAKAVDGDEAVKTQKSAVDVAKTIHIALPVQPASPAAPLVQGSHHAEPTFNPIQAASLLREVFSGKVGDPLTVCMQMRLYDGASPRIERTLKVPSTRKEWQRATLAFERLVLSAFTPAIALKAGLAFTFDGAHKFSMPELLSGKMAAPEQPFIQQRLPVHAEPPASSVVLGGDAVPTVQQINEATGVLTSAGSSTVTPLNGRPYTTFTVVLATTGGEISFSGNELKEKFNKRDFGLQDLVTIKKSKEEFTVQGHDGPKKRTKNSFSVTVLKKAQF